MTVKDLKELLIGVDDTTPIQIFNGNSFSTIDRENTGISYFSDAVDEFGNSIDEPDYECFVIQIEEDRGLIETLIEDILLLPTFTYSKYSKGRVLKEGKAGVSLYDLHRVLNQYRKVNYPPLKRVGLKENHNEDLL